MSGTPESLEDLIARVNSTIQFIESVKPAQIDGTEDKDVTISMRGNEVFKVAVNTLGRIVDETRL